MDTSACRAQGSTWTNEHALARGDARGHNTPHPHGNAPRRLRLRPAPRLTTLMAFVLALSLLLVPAMPALGAPAEDLIVTSYSLSKGSTANYTGTINKGDRATLSINVNDNRPFLSAYSPATPPSPGARLNTASFTIANQNDIKISNLTEIATGCWTYTVTFTNLTYTGSGQEFRCDLFYPAADSAPPLSYSLTIYQCTPPGEPVAPAPEPTVTVKGTGFVLEASNYGGGAIYAGKPFTLSLTWLATNGSTALENVVVNLTPSQEIALAKGASLIYVGSVWPGTSIPVSYELLAGATTAEGSYAIAVDVKGINAETGTEVSAQASITVPVSQPERFSILKHTLPTSLSLGMSTGAEYGSVTLVNQGRTPVSNVFIEVVGTGIALADGKQYLGTINGGEQKNADFSLAATQPGMIEAKLVVTYENARGEAKEIIEEFTVDVREDMDMGGAAGGIITIDGPGNAMQEEAPFPLWLVLLLGLAALVVLIVCLVVATKKRKAAKQAKLLAEDWDDDDDYGSGMGTGGFGGAAGSPGGAGAGIRN